MRIPSQQLPATMGGPETLQSDPAPGMQAGFAPVFAKPPFDISVRDIYEDLEPGELYLKNTIAPQWARKQAVERYFDPTNIGRTVEEMGYEQTSNRSAQGAMEMAMQSLEMGDEEFRAALEALDREAGAVPGQFTPQQPTAPNALQTGLSAVFGFSDPNRALEYGALPYGHQLDERDRNEALALQNLRLGEDARKRRVGALGDKAQLINQRDMASMRVFMQGLVQEGKGREKRFQQLMDGFMGKGANSSPGLRQSARQQLVSEFGYDPGPAADFTPAEASKNAGAALSTQRTTESQQKVLESRARVTHLGKLDEKIDAEIDKLVVEKGLKAWQKELIRAQAKWFPKEAQSRIVTNAARAQRMMDQTIIDQGRLTFAWANADRQSQISAHGQYIDTLQTLVNSLDEAGSGMIRQMAALQQNIQMDKLLNNGELSEEGLQYVQEYNTLRDAVYGQDGRGGLQGTLGGYRSALEQAGTWQPPQIAPQSNAGGARVGERRKHPQTGETFEFRQDGQWHKVK